MRERRTTELADVLEGALAGADVGVSSVAIDSRKVGPGALFFALRGEHTDGHRFVADAVDRGAAAVVVSDEVATTVPRIRVNDTERALLSLAADERAAMNVRAAAITGANGKTSTKDMAAAILATRWRTHASPASFNTEIGVPLSILSAPANTEALVLELGARHVGDVAMLCEVARPNAAVVTNVGVAHMEVFGSWDRIVEASAEPVEALGPHGTAILAADDPVVSGLAERGRGSVVTFGLSERADVRGIDVRLDRRGLASFTLAFEDEREPVVLLVPGEHMVQNALAASAVGIVFGLSAAECVAGLKDATVSAWRMETFENADGVVIVNDAYNANPESMAAGLKTARWIARDARLIAVLGHMAELGPVAQEQHERMGELVARLRVDELIAVGEQARPIAMAAMREGVDSSDVVTAENAEEAAKQAVAVARPRDVVFIKGSRVAGLERVAEALR